MANLFVSQTYKHFEEVADPRIDQGTNHPLMEMIFLTVCATICDADGWADVERYGKAKIDWLRKFYPFEMGIPSHDTLGRVFSRLDTVAFYSAMQNWANDIAISIQDQTVALDGKTLRGSFDSASSKSAFHLVTVWACGLRMCIAAKSIDSKSNEIPAVQQLIEQTELQGSVVTADAMNCQKDTAELIIKKEADYILQVKGNQPNLETAINDAITQAIENEDSQTRIHHKKEINRNRNEYRWTVVMPCPEDNPIFVSWEGIKTIGMIYRSRVIDGRTEEFVTMFITSLPCKVRDIAARIRQHWGIENSQHYVLEVTFSEDASRIRKGSGPEIASAFRRLALNILQKETSIKDTIRGKRKRCSWDNSAVEKLFASFSGV